MSPNWSIQVSERCSKSIFTRSSGVNIMFLAKTFCLREREREREPPARRLHWICWLKHDVNVAVLSQIGLHCLSHLMDITRAAWRHVARFILFYFIFSLFYTHIRPLGRCLSIQQTPERLCGLQKCYPSLNPQSE